MACGNSSFKTVEIILQNSTDFNMDLNAKNRLGYTAFQLACRNKNSNTAEMLKKMFAELDIKS